VRYSSIPFFSPFSSSSSWRKSLIEVSIVRTGHDAMLREGILLAKLNKGQELAMKCIAVKVRFPPFPSLPPIPHSLPIFHLAPVLSYPLL
jgi:hypothetical protein